MKLFGAQNVAVLALYTALGAALGLGTEWVNRRMGRAACGDKPCARMVVPKLLVIIALFALVQLLLPEFASDWQNTTPGLFFVGVFFGMQGSLFSDAQTLSTTGA